MPTPFEEGWKAGYFGCEKINPYQKGWYALNCNQDIMNWALKWNDGYEAGKAKLDRDAIYAYQKEMSKYPLRSICDTETKESIYSQLNKINQVRGYLKLDNRSPDQLSFDKGLGVGMIIGAAIIFILMRIF